MLTHLLSSPYTCWRQNSHPPLLPLPQEAMTKQALADNTHDKLTATHAQHQEAKFTVSHENPLLGV